MVIIRLTVVGIIVSAFCVVAHAQEGKPCPSGHICPVCSEENGVRTCRVEGLVAAKEQLEREAREDASWQARCGASIVTDSLGVKRYVFAPGSAGAYCK